MSYKKFKQELRKDKKFRGLNLDKLVNEFDAIESGNFNNQHTHVVPVNGVKYVSYDSKVLNKHLNQTGRGNYRVLAYDGSVKALAVHKKDNSYKILYNV